MLARAQRGALLLGAAREALAVDADHAAVGLVEAGEAGQQRRLARARRAGDGDDLAGVDGERHALQGERLVVAGVEEAVQALGLQQARSSRVPQRVGDDPPGVDVVGALRARDSVRTTLLAVVEEDVALDGVGAATCR